MLFFLIPGIIFLLLIGVFFFQGATPPPPLETTFGPERVISTAVDGPKRVYAADIDGDRDMDILTITLFDNQVVWYENMDGKGSFSQERIISTEISGGDGIFAADLDGDGDLDVLSASSSDGKIAWYENLNGLGTFGPQQVINPLAPMAYFVVAADLDQDGDLDVVYDAWDMNAIAWQENLDGQGTFGTVNIITNQAIGASSVHAADLDGDGDIDVLSTAATGNQIAWYKNTDGFGHFSTPIIISSQMQFPYSVIAADLDQDGDLDVLSASAKDNKIAWYENQDGQGTFGLPKIITDNALQAASVAAADLDGDGDLDVLSASSGDNTIAWYENDGEGNFSKAKVITNKATFVFSVIAADLDNDGDLDVIAAAVQGDKVVWYENLSPLYHYFPIVFHP